MGGGEGGGGKEEGGSGGGGGGGGGGGEGVRDAQRLLFKPFWIWVFIALILAPCTKLRAGIDNEKQKPARFFLHFVT